MGHDFWLEPDPARATRTSVSTTVSLLLGDHFVPEASRPFRLSGMPRLDLVHRGHVVDLKGPDEVEKLVLRLEGAGTHLLVLDGRWSQLELSAERFESYLEHEGLVDALAERHRRGEQAEPGRERYTRHLKAQIELGAGGKLGGNSVSVTDKAANAATAISEYHQTLELIPLANPALAAVGEGLAFRVKFQGVPLVNVRVEALVRVGDEVTSKVAYSDDDGVATFEVRAAGQWLVRMVHMIRCVEDTTVDWESHWAAYRFDVRA